MAYQTLYRKWRPKIFDEVVGQEHITSTLKNEIVNGRTAHAYIFTGTRGTGKTSTAKILSRALNCENHINGNPCNECSVCRGILDESILDVVEMDAASNNGVENIREIIDQVRYSTASSKYKVYIIDEVHMLSVGAFNALLKTLEEPPAHVVFILATTEIHKVPATILSRCQRFDFKNITSSDIAGAVGNILAMEGVAIERDAVEYIAYLGNGSMRDALSITEQCLAYKDNDITYSDVTEILGTLDDSFLFNAAEHIAKGNVKELLLLFDECMNKGKNPDSFAEGMLKAFRDILFYKMAPEICDFTNKKKELINSVAGLFGRDKLVRCIDILSASVRDIKLSSNTRVLVECTFIRMASPQYEADLSSVLDRISVIEKKIASGVTVDTCTPKPVMASEVRDELHSDLKEVTDFQTEAIPSDDNTKPAVSANADVSAVVAGWNDVKCGLEEKGKLISFVSLYGVNPRAEGDSIILPFDTKDAFARFNSSNAKADLLEVIAALFGINPDIKSIYEEKTNEISGVSNDIFDDIAKISTKFPENFKID